MIRALLKDSATKLAPIKNINNEITGWTPTPIKCRWLRKEKEMKTEGGKQLISSATITIENQTIDNSYKIERDGVKYVIIRINEAKDFSTRALTVFLQ